GAGHFQNAEGPQNFEKSINFVHRAGDFDDEGFRSDVDYAAPKNLDEFHQVGTILLAGGNFDQCEVALKYGTVSNVFGQKNVDEFFERRFQTMSAFFIGVRT